MLYVSRHLLRSYQHALDIGIGGARRVRTAIGVNVQSRAREQLQRRLLQTPFRNADAQLHGSDLSICAAGLSRGRCSVKQERVPLWQTTPFPCPRTCSRTVSRSQSVVAETTSSRFPEVSPLVQSWLRVRLKNVTYPARSVCSNASRFMKPSISTSPLPASCTIAGNSPCILWKSISWLIAISKVVRRNKKPAVASRVSGPNLVSELPYL